MAYLDASLRREFVRRVYREASPATEEGRSDYLDTLSDAAIGKLQNGKILTGSSDKGTSAQYAMLSKYSPEQLIDLVDFARDWIGYDTIAEALAAMLAAPPLGIVNLRNTVTANTPRFTIPS